MAIIVNDKMAKRTKSHVKKRALPSVMPFSYWLFTNDS